MALFNKFFFSSSSKKKHNSNTDKINSSLHFPFDSNQVRILLYRECDANGRRLLFDSNSIQKVAINENKKQSFKSNLQNNKTKLFDNLDNQTPKSESLLNDNFIEISNGFGYKHTRPTSSDISNIGEMVFGALAMSFRSPSLKVHWLQAPSRILCSQVFLSPLPNAGCLLNQKDLLGSPSNSNSNLNSGQKLKKESSESFDGYLVSSLSKPFSPLENYRNMQLSALPKINDTNLIKPSLDVPSEQIEIDKKYPQSLDAITPTIGSDSGYATISDCWTSRSSYQYSTRSSMGSVLSDPLSTYDSLRKFSLDSGKYNCGDDGSINNCLGSTLFSMSVQKNPINSDINISRRISRNMQTSFENHNSICDFVGFINDNYQTVTTTSGGSDGCVTAKYNNKLSADPNESHSNPELRNNSNSSTFNVFGGSNSFGKICKNNLKRSKLGLAVCISMSESYEKEMEEFCCEHIALLESMLFRLRASVEFAYLNHKKFLKIMLHAWQNTVEWISDFFTVQRLSAPIWYSVTSSQNKSRKQLTDNFVKEFCWLLKTYDSKDTNFFISTMVTAVLTHHLGWAASVISPPNLESKNQNANGKQNYLKNLANQYSYNPLWAQMCDMYGAIGNPIKISRTIINGKDRNLVAKFLHILTYFIRCSEIRRNSISNDFKIHSFDEILNKNDQKLGKNLEKPKKKKLGFCRNTTFNKNLFELSSTDQNKECLESRSTSNVANVITYHSSRSVNRELCNLTNDNIFKKSDSKGNIKFTVTTPEEIVIPLDDEISNVSNETLMTEDYEALEAIEIEDTSEINIIQNLKPPNIIEKLNFWKLEPIVKEGLSFVDIVKYQKDTKIKDTFLGTKSPTNLNVSNDNDITSNRNGKASWPLDNKNISLSNLITENSVGKSERFVWGIEPIKENVCLEEEKHFEESQKFFEKDRNYTSNKNDVVNPEKGKGVLFVLGDNEHLIDIKKNIENESPKMCWPKSESEFESHHNKKYTGVKFNLEEYPESATYFLNKKINFEKSNYDFNQRIVKIEKPLNYDFWTKCTCDNNVVSSTSTATNDLNKKKSEKGSENKIFSSNTCEFCKTATGEEAKDIYIPHEESKKDLDEKSKLACGGQGARKNIGSLNKKFKTKDENISCLPLTDRGLHIKTNFQKLKERNKKIENLDIKFLPMPEINNSDENLKNNESNNSKTGFIPSLFIGVSDRYIPDMVLQGTVSPFSIWETNIKNDLIIASHCASLISQPTENIAIIGDIDKWEIKIITSQNNIIPCTGSSSGIVGMSQLVSQLLEGFYIMSNSGISSYECLIYLESKLKEIYLQSEALAGLLLTTEFCSLNSVTTALNLSENDVPLLLAIASTHSPQVTKRYGISFG